MENYNTQTLENPSWIKRFSHKARFSKALELVSPQPGEHVLDYGAGDGSLTLMLLQKYPEAHLSLFEPTAELHQQAINHLAKGGSKISFYTEIYSVETDSLDVIVCQEVLEHLPQAQRDEAIFQFSRLLKRNGKLVISVPIEIGISALFKNLVRVLIGQSQEGSSVMNFLRATFGKTAKIPRVARSGYIDSHLGFDYRELADDLVKKGWIIEQDIFTPLPWMKGFFNSQVFFCLRQP